MTNCQVTKHVLDKNSCPAALLSLLTCHINEWRLQFPFHCRCMYLYTLHNTDAPQHCSVCDVYYLSRSRIFLSVCSSTSEKSWWVFLTFSCSWIPSTDRLCKLSGPVIEAKTCTSSNKLSACSSWDWSCWHNSCRQIKDNANLILSCIYWCVLCVFIISYVLFKPLP